MPMNELSRSSLIKGLRMRLSTRPAQQRLRDVLLGGGDWADLATFREDLARRYLGGEGIEIGALHRPLRLPPATHVRYVDIMSRADLLATHSSAVYGNPRWVVETDVLDNGEILATFADESVDFVVANHMLEHTEDPIAALSHLVRVLRSSGILFVALPDARHTLDVSRPRTTVEHLLRDHSEGPASSREQHYREWAEVECLPKPQIADRVAEFRRTDTRHHFHVWELGGFLDLLRAIQLDATLELAQCHLDEFVVVLRKEQR
jgi:SAM-dependent methyltransferase